MKIAQVVSTYPPYRGGMGSIAHTYTEHLRARGHDVHVYTPRYRAVQYDPDYIHRVPSPIHVGNAGVVPSLFNRLKGLDIIHLHYPFFGGAEPVIVRKAVRPDQALVLTYHMDPIARGLNRSVPRFGFIQRFSDHFAVRAILKLIEGDHAITPSPFPL